MNKEIIETIQPILQQLAVELNTTVDMVWGILLKQADAKIISNITMYVFTSIGLLCSFKLVERFLYKQEKVSDIATVFIALFCMLTFGMLLSTIFSLPDTIELLLNPDYYALNKIIRYMK